MKHKITILNPVEAECGPALAKLITPCLSYPSAFYKQGIHHKIRVESSKCVLQKDRSGMYFFWAGLINHVQEYCKTNGIELEVTDKSKEDYPLWEPLLPGVTFRDDQNKMMNSFLDKLRGILIGFTGIGKTVLGFGILSCFEDTRTIWLCHTKALMTQAYEEGLKFGFTNIGRMGDGYHEIDKAIVIATRQSFKTIADKHGHEFDIVVVDEVHHLSTAVGEYSYILERLMSPVRLGLTATLKREGERYLVATGLIGPILNEMTIQDGMDVGILTKPQIKILKLKKDHSISALHKYSEVYQAAVVNRLDRNILIAATAKKHADLNETVLIIITIIDHGKNILKQLTAMGVKAAFVQGSTKTDSREELKKALNDKTIHCVICSVIWIEGVNIPTLNCVINASGGKDDVRVLQGIGRGLRQAEGKECCYFYDFLDTSHRYLIEHFGERLIVYLDSSWL